MQALRKQKKPMSDRAAGRAMGRRSPHLSNLQQETTASGHVINGPPPQQRKLVSAATQKRRHQRHGTSTYSSKAAKNKWHLIERRVSVDLFACSFFSCPWPVGKNEKKKIVDLTLNMYAKQNVINAHKN